MPQKNLTFLFFADVFMQILTATPKQLSIKLWAANFTQYAFLAENDNEMFSSWEKPLSHRNYWTAKKMKSRSDELLQPS